MEVARFEPRAKSKSYQTCAVSGCNSRSDKDLTIRFHKFPTPNKNFVNLNNEKVDRLAAWKTLLNIDHITPKKKVCSLHFLKSDYFFAEVYANKRVLKRIAVPSCNLPGNNKAVEKKKVKKVPRTKSKVPAKIVPKEEVFFVNCKMEAEEVDYTKETSNSEFANFQAVSIKSEIATEAFFKDASVQASGNSSKTQKDAEVQAKPIDSQFSYEEFIKKHPKNPQFSAKDNKEVQVNTECFVSTVIHSIKTDSDLLVSTGIESFKVLNTIVQRVIEIFGDKYEHPNVPMNTRDRVIMTYMICKHNLSYSFVSVLFGQYTPTHYQRIFAETLKILSKCPRDGIPSLGKIPPNMRKHYRRTSEYSESEEKERCFSSPATPVHTDKGRKVKEEARSESD